MNSEVNTDSVGFDSNPEQQNNCQEEDEKPQNQNSKIQLNNIISKLAKYNLFPLLRGIIIFITLYVLLLLYIAPFPDFMHFVIEEDYKYGIHPEFLKTLCLFGFEYKDYGFVYFAGINNLISNEQYLVAIVFWVLFLIYVSIISPNNNHLELNYIIVLNYLIIIISSASIDEFGINVLLFRSIYWYFFLSATILIIIKFVISLISIKAKEIWFQQINIREKVKEIIIEFFVFFFISILFVIINDNVSLKEAFIYLENITVIFFGISFFFIGLIWLLSKVFKKISINKE